ncbi:P-type ATPase [Oceanirhabdus sp. W0125-5]|uniref:P-type ATPase n=1 Tax=Oceanirhabdus sp. W0125-5 TaxID=2999116 RepID=UPI0022F32CCE|nr:cation-transporting P-type ATPase [Oceanirhabdus sp. W0125-5]WBW95794.1 cation-transporting P-type ATPase [Oceanirhabdus sp. W0125-5]
MKNYYNLSWKNVLDQLNADEIHGLADSEISLREDVHGDNYIYYPKNNSILKGITGILLSPWALSFLILISLSFYGRNSSLAFYFFGLFMVFMLMFLGKDKEKFKLKKQLANLNNSSAIVIRSGVKKKVSIGNLVVGDTVILSKGSFVPADMRLIQAKSLFVNELAVTGENYPAEKFVEKIDDKNPPLTHMKNMVFRSTVVTKGEGVGVVIATGMESEIGKLVKSVFFKDEKQENQYSLEKSLNIIVLISLVMSAVFSILRYFTGNGENIFGSLLKSVFISNISFLAILYIVLIYRSIIKLKADGIEVNNTNSFYAMKDMDTIIMDKYDMLSNPYYYVGAVYTNEQYLTVNEIERQEDRQKKFERINEVSSSCCTYFEEDEYHKKSKGIKQEYSLLRFIFNIDMRALNLKSKNKEVLTLPFDKERNIKTVVSRVDKKVYRAASIGAIDKLLERSTYLYKDGTEVPMTNEDLEKIKKASYKLAHNGCIIIGVAYRNYNYIPSEDENVESNMVFVGMWGIKESVDIEAAESLEVLKNNDVNVVLKCDENKIAATTIGRELGLVEEGVTAISGLELECLSENELRKLLNTCSVYSQINSYHKEEFSKILSGMGRKILGIGSKLRDISYLYRSNLKVAFGEDVSEILKKSSDVYISKGNIKSLMKVMGHGYKLIEKFFLFENMITCVLSFILSWCFINAINGFEFTYLTAVISNIIFLMNGIIAINISSNVSKKPKVDKGIRGYYLFGSVIICALSSGFAILSELKGALSAGESMTVILLVFAVLSLFMFTTLGELLKQFNYLIVFILEGMMLLSFFALESGKKLLGISLSNMEIGVVAAITLAVFAVGNLIIKMNIKK